MLLLQVLTALLLPGWRLPSGLVKLAKDAVQENRTTAKPLHSSYLGVVSPQSAAFERAYKRENPFPPRRRVKKRIRNPVKNTKQKAKSGFRPNQVATLGLNSSAARGSRGIVYKVPKHLTTLFASNTVQQGCVTGRQEITVTGRQNGRATCDHNLLRLPL